MNKLPLVMEMSLLITVSSLGYTYTMLDFCLSMISQTASSLICVINKIFIDEEKGIWVSSGVPNIKFKFMRYFLHLLCCRTFATYMFALWSISCLGQTVDTVVMNPPFGTRKKGADMDFLSVALKVSIGLKIDAICFDLISFNLLCIHCLCIGCWARLLLEQFIPYIRLPQEMWVIFLGISSC